MSSKPKAGMADVDSPFWGAHISFGHQRRHTAHSATRGTSNGSVGPRVGRLVGSEDEHADPKPLVSLHIDSKSLSIIAIAVAVTTFLTVGLFATSLGANQTVAAVGASPPPQQAGHYALAFAEPNHPTPLGPAAAVTEPDRFPREISLDAYGEQVILATLTDGLHEISTSSVTFYRDPDQPGNAIQQFAQKFGAAVSTGRAQHTPNQDEK